MQEINSPIREVRHPKAVENWLKEIKMEIADIPKEHHVTLASSLLIVEAYF